MFKRFLSILFILALCLSLIPVQVFAATEIHSIEIEDLFYPSSDPTRLHVGQTYTLSGRVTTSNCQHSIQYSEDGTYIYSGDFTAKAGNNRWLLLIIDTATGYVFSSDVVNNITISFKDGTTPTNGPSTAPTITLGTNSKNIMIKWDNYFDVTDHSSANGPYTDEGSSYHTYECDVCGDTIQEAHSFGGYIFNGNDKHYKECAKCNRIETTDCTPNSSGYQSDGANTHHFTCQHCSGTVTEEHRPDNQWHTDADEHWKECMDCGEHVNTAAHTESGQYTSDPNHHWDVCGICSANFNQSEHNISQGLRWNENDHYHYCTECNYEPLSEAEHNSSVEWTSDANYHWHDCLEPGCAYQIGKQAHTFSSVNYTYDDHEHWHKCDTCDAKSDVASHSFSYEEYTDDQHRKFCATCSYSTYEDHNWDNGVITLHPTSTTTGLKLFTCTNCGKTREDVIPASGGGGGGGGAVVVNTAIGTGTGYTWGERGIFSAEGVTLYLLLDANDEPGQILVSKDTWTLADVDPVPPERFEIVDVYVTEDEEPTYWATATMSGSPRDPLSNAGYYIVDTQNGDRALNFKGLSSGDVVRTTTFNGIYLANVTRTDNPNYETDLQRVKSNIFASYRAFEFDHPEIFWLNGSLKLRILTPIIGGKQVSYLFLTTADSTGFTMRIPYYAATGAIEKGIATRNACEDAIYASLPKENPRETIVAINKWLTLHNEYNRSADLSTIGLVPHQVLPAIVGSEGVNGPVCDGYSKAFKMLCDRCGIPCVLVTGTANNKGHTEHHMWNEVMLNGHWYGVDCAWNDPVVKGIYGAVSGYENEKFLLVGAHTVIDGMRFDASHMAEASPAAVPGIVFSPLELEDDSDYAVPFDDISITDWFYEYVKDVFYKDLMRGVTDVDFSPNGTTTRGQVVQILYNLAGQPAVKEVTVEGWYGTAASWALEKGIVAGFPDGDFHGDDPVTREQLATMLWAYEGAPDNNGALEYADADTVQEYAVKALYWANRQGLIQGKPGNLADPQGLATRAEIATIFSNFTSEE